MLWLKALHVIAVIAWMAGLLYLPRLFVYHADAEPGSEQSETFKVMERRLLRVIMNPAMIVVWITGPWLAWGQGMLHGRLAAGQVRAGAWLLTGYHHALGRWRKDFAADRNTRSVSVLPDRQRGADGADDRHRHTGDREAFLTRISCEGRLFVARFLCYTKSNSASHSRPLRPMGWSP